MACGRLGDLGVGLGAAQARRIHHAVAQVVVEQSDGDRLERTGQRADLGEDVDAVLLVLDHLVDAAGLPLDALEAVEVLVLVGDVAVVAVRRVVVAVGSVRVVSSVMGGPEWCAARTRRRGSGRRPRRLRMRRTRLRNERRRRLLPTTKTLESAIAAPAIIGLSRPSAASGIAATL